MTARGKGIHLARAQHGFAARQEQQRLMIGQRLAALACREAAQRESDWQRFVATLPLRMRLWIAFLIVVRRWGTWRGSLSAPSGEGGDACAPT